MTKNEDLHKRFLAAIEEANAYPETLPTDIKLQFYAYYKQATVNTLMYRPSDQVEIRNAFKLNALFQVGKFSVDEAKEKYIELVKKHLR